MQVFKCALRIIRGHIVFPLIYIVGLSFMGVFMALSFSFGQASGEFERVQADYAIVDRDGSVLSAGIAEALSSQGERIEVADEPRAFQDAVAKGTVDYLLVVPEGYGQAFLDAAYTGEEPPTMETVYSYYSMEGSFVDESVKSYLSAVRTLAIAQSGALPEELVDGALEATNERADAEVLATEAAMTEADRFVFYLQWSSYTLFAGIAVCVGVLTAIMGRADVRRRNLASALPLITYNLQLAAACLVVAFGAWIWSFAVGVIAFPAAVEQISVIGLAWCAASVLSFCLIPLGVGFLLGTLGASALVSNAVGNIAGMVLSFFSGAWISLDLMAPEVLALAHGLPGYWYSEACATAAHLASGASFEAMLPVLQDIGVMLLFAVTLLCIALVVGKARARTATAGGNRAASAQMI